MFFKLIGEKIWHELNGLARIEFAAAAGRPADF
jgi:hypothetical protein